VEGTVHLEPLPLDSWRDTYATLHRWVQLVGKIQLALTPRVNHFWNVGFRLSARGLATPAIPWRERSFDIELDFLGHELRIRTSDGDVRRFALAPMSVARFHDELFAQLRALGIKVSIYERPVELQSEAIPFPRDEVHASYDHAWAERCWRVLAWSAVAFEQFRARFIGKCSPVLFYWGTFDLAVNRYSGRRAPERSDADPITREAYSHEVSSLGFWPGDARFPEAAFFAYTAPVPDRLEMARVRPGLAFWADALGTFLLPYETVRRTADPRAVLLEFAQSTYEAGAELAGWDRAALERDFRPAQDEPRLAGHPPAPG
jgi:hypothetical protein